MFTSDSGNSSPAAIGNNSSYSSCV